MVSPAVGRPGAPVLLLCGCRAAVHRYEKCCIMPRAVQRQPRGAAGLQAPHIATRTAHCNEGQGRSCECKPGLARTILDPHLMFATADNLGWRGQPGVECRCSCRQRKSPQQAAAELRLAGRPPPHRRWSFPGLCVRAGGSVQGGWMGSVGRGWSASAGTDRGMRPWA